VGGDEKCWWQVLRGKKDGEKGEKVEEGSFK
jgi:hypothetical protein